MKTLFISIALLILFSCSSNPKMTNEAPLEELLIEKPSINYKPNSLPKDINVIYFSDTKLKGIFPDEVKGLLTNYYYFSSKYEYFPDIKFINLNTVNSCNLKVNRGTYYFIFLLQDSSINKKNYLCINTFINQESLLISDLVDESISKDFKRFLISRDEDKLELIRLMDSYSKNIMVIDNEVTKDKYEIGEAWQKEYKKDVFEYKTIRKEESSQNIFSNLLLSEQSLKRKRKLSRTISEDLSHKSRTRKDIDTLFLSVNIQEARSLKPALDYNYFDDMQVFLANYWQGNIEFSMNDRDLLNVISIDIPFMLQIPLPDDLKILGERTRSFAIGYDSFEILLLLKSSRNINETIKDQTLRSPASIKGHKEINKKTIKKTIPKFLFVGNFILSVIKISYIFIIIIMQKN